MTQTQWTIQPITLAAEVRTAEGWEPKDAKRIADALTYYPNVRAYIGSANVNGLVGEVWMEPRETGTRLSVYGPFGTVLWWADAA